jgi:ribosomal protein S18 acetylase RimI-like enzyme
LKVASMKLTVRMSNQAALALYEKEGYQTVDVWKGYYSDGEDGVVMEKILSKA